MVWHHTVLRLFVLWHFNHSRSRVPIKFLRNTTTYNDKFPKQNCVGPSNLSRTVCFNLPEFERKFAGNLECGSESFKKNYS